MVGVFADPAAQGHDQCTGDHEARDDSDDNRDAQRMIKRPLVSDQVVSNRCFQMTVSCARRVLKAL